MAYVAISDNLKAEICRIISAKRGAERSTVPAPSPVVIYGSDPTIQGLLWGEHLHLRDQIPESWCTKVSSLTVRTNLTLQEDTSVAVRFPLNLTGQCLAPPRTSQYDLTIELLESDPLIAARADYERQVRLIELKWDKVEVDVTKFLNSCKSLNEALKLWPDLRVYVPQKFLNKVEEKAAKAKAAESKAMEILKSIDTDHAIASAVMVRMLEASKQEPAQ